MVLIIKKFVRHKQKLPNRYKGLGKWTFVTKFLNTYITIPFILNSQYGVDWDDKILVFSVQLISNKGYDQPFRTAFKKVFCGTLTEFKDNWKFKFPKHKKSIVEPVKDIEQKQVFIYDD